VYSIISESTFREIPEIVEQILRIKDNENVSYMTHLLIVFLKVPMVLVGNKVDLEEDRKVPTTTGEATANKYKNCSFVESSAKLQINVKETFEILVRKIHAQEPKEKKHKKDPNCVLI
jgi:GTPase SAR1 family protein